jgi:hypothetical protein
MNLEAEIVITILREQLADALWKNVLLEAQVRQLTTAAPTTEVPEPRPVD